MSETPTAPSSNNATEQAALSLLQRKNEELILDAKHNEGIEEELREANRSYYAAKIEADNLQQRLDKAEAARELLWNAIRDIRGWLVPQPGHSVPREEQHRRQDEAVIKAHEIAMQTMQQIQLADAARGGRH